MYSNTKYARNNNKDYDGLLRDCGARSLGWYVAAYSGKDNCFDIDHEDIENTKYLIKECANREKTIRNLIKEQRIVEKKFKNIRSKRKSYRKSFDDCVIAYENGLLQFLIGFLIPFNYSEGNDKQLEYTRIYGNRINMNEIREYYEYLLKNINYHNKYVNYIKVVGLRLCKNCKYYLFKYILLKNFYYLLIGLICVMFILILYTRSLLIMISTFLEIIFSFVSAYFIYHIVFGIKFFPFMNFVALLILIAIGTDDVFIFFDAFQQELSYISNYDNNNLFTVVENTLKHVMYSISVTSITTSTAFFTGMITSITSLKCFSLFCGIAVLSNLFFMILWIPPIFIFKFKLERKFNYSKIIYIFKLDEKLLELKKKLLNMIKNSLYKFLLNYSMELIIFLTTIGISGIIIVIVTPKFKLPNQDNFPVYTKGEILEDYDEIYKKLFRDYEEIKRIRNMNKMLPINIVFGSKLIDKGNNWNPDDLKILNPDNKLIKLINYNFLKFIKKLTIKLLNENWSKRFINKNKLINFLDYFKLVLSENCMNINKLCCGINVYSWDNLNTTYKDSLIDNCFIYVSRKSVNLPTLYNYIATKDNNNTYLLDYPVYNNINGNLSFYLITVLSKQEFTTKYEPMNKLKLNLDYFIHNLKQDEYLNLIGIDKDNVFYSTRLVMYEIQYLLSTNTYESMGISLIISFFIMLFTTFNVLLTIFSIISIGFSIFTTTAILVICGWQLNIIESVTISLAVGLSIDFVIHYAIAFKMALNYEKREEKVRECLFRVFMSVSVAALTTLLTGLCAIPSSVDVFHKLGTFLVVVMTISWLYSTFFFLSLCLIIGPENDCGQLSIPIKYISSTLQSTQSNSEEEDNSSI